MSRTAGITRSRGTPSRRSIHRRSCSTAPSSTRLSGGPSATRTTPKPSDAGGPSRRTRGTVSGVTRPASSVPARPRASAVPSRALVALATLASPSGGACRRHGPSAAGAVAGPSTPLEAVGEWAGLRVRTAGERAHPRQVVILMHGWGAPGTDLVPLARPLEAPGRLFVFPEAPLVSPGGGRA